MVTTTNKVYLPGLSHSEAMDEGRKRVVSGLWKRAYVVRTARGYAVADFSPRSRK